MYSKIIKNVFSLTNYGDINWNYLTGFDQVVIYGIVTYYVVDYGVLDVDSSANWIMGNARHI